MPTIQSASETFDSLYSEFDAKVRQIVGRALHNVEDTLDCSQIVWTKLWARLQAGEPIRDPGAYLKTAAFTQALQFRRNRSAHAMDSLEEIAELEHAGGEEGGNSMDRVLFGIGMSSEPVLSRSFKDTLRSAVDSLPARTGQIITLFYWGDKSVAEIASELHIAAGTVKWHLSTGRGAIKSICFGMREVA